MSNHILHTICSTPTQFTSITLSFSGTKWCHGRNTPGQMTERIGELSSQLKKTPSWPGFSNEFSLWNMHRQTTIFQENTNPKHELPRHSQLHIYRVQRRRRTTYCHLGVSFFFVSWKNAWVPKMKLPNLIRVGEFILMNKNISKEVEHQKLPLKWDGKYLPHLINWLFFGGHVGWECFWV